MPLRRLAARLVPGLCVVVTGCKPGGAAGGAGSLVEAGPPVECTALPRLAPRPAYRVGFVPIYEPNNPWGIANTNDMIVEAQKRGDHLVYSPFVGDAPAQAASMQQLIDARVDAIILRPIDAHALAPSVVAARKACIPVFTENRLVDPLLAVPGTDYVAAIGADPEDQGQAVAEWLVASGVRGPVVEIEGTPGSSSATGRKRGFDRVVAADPNLPVVASDSGRFDRAAARGVARRLLGAHPETRIVYAHADVMALGAVAALRDLGREPGRDVMVVSIDGLREAVEHVVDGSIAAIEYNDPKLAGRSLDAVEDYAAGRPVSSRIVVPGHIIDRTNASALMSETF
jgi:ribose transport system substrate-binding protein